MIAAAPARAALVEGRTAGGGAALAAARRRSRIVPQRRGQPPLERALRAFDVAVVEQEDVQREREIAEEPVVRGGDVQDLKSGEQRRAQEPQAPRAEDREGNDQLQHQHGPALEVVPRRGQVVRPPAEPGRQRRGLVIERHRAAVVPVVLWRLPLRDARLEVELEQHQPEQEVGERRRATGGQEAGEQAALEQQVVPLERQERAARGGVAEVERDRQREAEAPPYASERRDGEQRAGDGAADQHGVAVHPPEHRREIDERDVAARADRLDEIAERHEAPGPEQKPYLDAERDPGDEKDQRQQPAIEISNARARIAAPAAGWCRLSLGHRCRQPGAGPPGYCR